MKSKQGLTTTEILFDTRQVKVKDSCRRMKFWTYFHGSLLFVISVVTYAAYTREQFYPTMLYLVRSKVSMVAGGNLILALTLLFGRISKSVFFGTLRDAEIELLLEKAKYTVTETCLALTIFRSELNPSILAMFGLLLFLKSFHWLSSSRLEHLEQIMPVSMSTHIRLSVLILLLLTCDMGVAYYCIQHTIANGKSVLILFGFECGVLVISVFNTICRFIIHVVDINTRHGLVSKGLYIMIVDLICDAFRFVTYVFFFCLVFVYYGLPIHIIREVGVAFYNFQRRLVSLIKYLRLTKNLDERFENATQEEMVAAGDCLICREGMETGKKLACGHVFHLDCLRMWLQHQQTCPLCRADIPLNATINRPQPEAPVNPDVPVPDDNNVIVNNTIEPVNEADSLEGGPSLSTDPNIQTFPAFYFTCVEPNLKIYERTDTTSNIVRVIKPGITIFVQSKLTVNGDNWLQINDGWFLEFKVGSQEHACSVLPVSITKYSPQERRPFDPSTRPLDPSYVKPLSDLLAQPLGSHVQSPRTASNTNTPFSTRSRNLDRFRGVAPFSAPIDDFEDYYSDKWEDLSPNTNRRSSPGLSATPNSRYSSDSAKDKLLLMQLQLRDLSDGLKRMQGFAQSCEKALSHLISDETNKTLDAEEIKKVPIKRGEEEASQDDFYLEAKINNNEKSDENNSSTEINNEIESINISRDNIGTKENALRELRAQYFSNKYQSNTAADDNNNDNTNN